MSTLFNTNVTACLAFLKKRSSTGLPTTDLRIFCPTSFAFSTITLISAAIPLTAK